MDLTAENNPPSVRYCGFRFGRVMSVRVCTCVCGWVGGSVGP